MSHANFIVLKPLNGICKPKFRVNSSHLDVQGFPWKECFVHIVKLGGLQYHYRSISPISIPQGSCSHGISVAFQTENSIYWLFGRFLRILILGLKVWFAQSNWKFGLGWGLLVPVLFHPSVTWCIVQVIISFAFPNSSKYFFFNQLVTHRVWSFRAGQCNCLASRQCVFSSKTDWCNTACNRKHSFIAF